MHSTTFLRILSRGGGGRNPRPPPPPPPPVLKPPKKPSSFRVKLIQSVATDPLTKTHKVLNQKSKSTHYVKISNDVSCTCCNFAKTNTPCKHVIWVMLNIFGIVKGNNILQQIHLTARENHKTGVIKQVSNQASSMTTKALLFTTSTKRKPFVGRLPDPVSPDVPLPLTPAMPEPRNDPYWVIVKKGQMITCNGCKEKTLGKIILGRIEFDYFPKFLEDSNKQWRLSNSARYYHLDIECLRLRRPHLTLTEEALRFGPDTKLDGSIKTSLEL